MPYATPDDMIAEYGQREMRIIGDPEGTGSIVVERVLNALSKASDQIDFYVGQRCALPLVSVEPAAAAFLQQLCMDMARYRLTGSSGISATDEVKNRYQEADDKLKLIASGKIVLADQGSTAAGNPGLQVDSLTAGEATYDAAPRVFARGSLADYMGRFP